MLALISSTATPSYAAQRKLIFGIVLVTLVVLAIVIAELAGGGRPDPQTLRAAAILLDGSWRGFIPAMTHSGRMPLPTTAVGRR
jgi:hypothetical protein